MSQLKYEDVDVPLTPKTGAKLIGHVEQRETVQLVAADLADQPIWVATFDGQIGDVIVASAALPSNGGGGAVETMQWLLKKNGSTIVDKTVALSTHPDKVNSLYSSLAVADRSFVKGDYFTVTRDYTAGGAATPMGANSMRVEFSIAPYLY